jgi:hypothetical protein
MDIMRDRYKFMSKYIYYVKFKNVLSMRKRAKNLVQGVLLGAALCLVSGGALRAEAPPGAEIAVSGVVETENAGNGVAIDVECILQI